MYIILFFVLLITAFLFFAFIKPMRIFFLFDSNKMDMHISMTWLPLLKIEAKTIHFRTHISVYIFNIKIVSKLIEKKKNVDQSVLNTLNLQNTCLRFYYGLNEPHLTGMLYGALSFIGSFIQVEVLEQFPEFVPVTEYLRMEARSNLNVGKTILSFFQLKFAKLKRRKNYGSV